MFRRFGHEEAIRKIAEAGFDAVDFSFYRVRGEDGFLNRPDYLDYARHLRAVAEENGICIAQSHAPFDNKFEFEPEKIAKGTARSAGAFVYRNESASREAKAFMSSISSARTSPMKVSCFARSAS